MSSYKELLAQREKLEQQIKKQSRVNTRKC